MRRCIFAVVCMISLVLLTSCGGIRQQASDELGIDIKGSSISVYEESHGWFGDGTTYAAFNLDDTSAADEISQSLAWHALPLTDNLTTLVYGTEYSHNNMSYRIGPYVHLSGSQEPCIPQIEHGAYLFIDRHPTSTAENDDSSVLSRGSMNFTIAIYDSDTNILYYVRFDT